MSFARGCLAEPPSLVRLCRRGDDRSGEAGRIDRLGSSAKEFVWDPILEFVSCREFTSAFGPNEKDEPIEPRFLEGEGRLGIGGMLYCCVGGGVDVIAHKWVQDS